jgi:anaerobic magnesium-protoporphyrin IX monomethyl ester cyclase
MQICLISLVEDIGCTNLRYLSSYIKNKGHKSQVIFLPRLYSEGWEADESYRYPYNPKTIQQIKEICRESDIIGISLMSCHFDNAINLTKHLKELHKPIIWGGIHPTISPHECLRYADMVCVGEGENSIVSLLDNMENSRDVEHLKIPGILTKTNQQLTVGQKIHNLDDLGFIDYDMENQFILYQNNIVKINRTILSKCFNGRYRTSFSKGCVYACTYCCNNVLTKLYGNKVQPIRWRSLESQIKEIVWAKDSFDGLTYIDFSDDTFLSRPYEEIAKFASMYKSDVNLPFRALSTPLAVSYNKLKILVDAGMYHIGIGIQTINQPVRELYKRKETLKQIVGATEIIKQVSRETNTPITVRYDFITDNPWGGETEVEENIRFGMTLPKPREIRVFSLVFYHGTELYEKAKKDGLIKDELNDGYRVSQLSPKPTYMNEVFLLLCMGCPQSLIQLLINNKIKIRSIVLAKIVKKLLSIMQLFKKPNRIETKKQKSCRFDGSAGEVLGKTKFAEV